MSTMNPELARDKLPGLIEAIQEEHLKKMPAAAAFIEEQATQLNVPQLTADAKAFTKAVEANAEWIKKMCGEEGDKGTETGSLWGAVSMAKTIIKATGGEA